MPESDSVGSLADQLRGNHVAPLVSFVLISPLQFVFISIATRCHLYYYLVPSSLLHVAFSSNFSLACPIRLQRLSPLFLLAACAWEPIPPIPCMLVVDFFRLVSREVLR
jgi:hypothetical protein